MQLNTTSIFRFNLLFLNKTKTLLTITKLVKCCIDIQKEANCFFAWRFCTCYGWLTLAIRPAVCNTYSWLCHFHPVSFYCLHVFTRVTRLCSIYQNKKSKSYKKKGEGDVITLFSASSWTSSKMSAISHGAFIVILRAPKNSWYHDSSWPSADSALIYEHNYKIL